MQYFCQKIICIVSLLSLFVCYYMENSINSIRGVILKKRLMIFILAFAMIIFFLFPGTTAFAADTLCISQIKIEAGDNAAEKLEGGGFTVIYQNLNPSGGDRIYLGYKLGKTPITNLAVSSQAGGAVTVDSVSYTPASSVNLNRGTGGSPVYLYSTTDPKAGSGILSLSFVKDVKDGSVNLLDCFGDGSVPVRTSDGSAADFDEGISARNLYLFMIKENSCKPYVSDIKTVNVSSGENAFKKIAASGCDYFNREPVSKVNGVSTYLCFNRTADASQAVRFVSASDNLGADGIAYTSAGSYVLNEKNVNLYYTRDKTVGNPVSEITDSSLTKAEFTLSDWAKSYFSRAESSAMSQIYSEELYNSLIESQEEYTQLKIKDNSGDIGLYMILSAKGIKTDSLEERVVTLPSEQNEDNTEMQRDTEITGIEKENTAQTEESKSTVNAYGSAIGSGSLAAIAVLAIIAVVVAFIFVTVKSRKKTENK